MKMINKMNHRNGITLPNGEYYEARVGSTRWFNAERAERALSEVRPEVDRAIELVNRAFNTADAKGAFEAIIEIIETGLDLKAVGVYSWQAPGSMTADMMKWGNCSEEMIAEFVENWQNVLSKLERKGMIEETAVKTAMELVIRGHWGFWSKNGWFEQVEVEVAEVENAEVEQTEVESNEQSSENSEVKEDNTVNQERLSGECVANVGGCRVQVYTPNDMVNIDAALRCLRRVFNDEETLNGFLEMAGRHGNVVSSESFLARAESVKAGRQRFFLRAKTEDLSSYLLAESGKEATIRKNGNYTWSARKDGAVLEVWVQGEKGVLWWRNTLRE